MSFNPQLVDQTAADIFWGHSFFNDFQDTVRLVQNDKLKELWTIADATAILKEIDPFLPENAFPEFYKTVNLYIQDKVARHENIIGSIYTEDFVMCRPPNFQFDNFLKKAEKFFIKEDRAVSIIGSAPQALGSLLLRTPLPAVVLHTDENFPKYIRIENTEVALGFPKTIFMETKGFGIFPDNDQNYKIGIQGIFYIPASDETSPIWQKLIPNSIYFKEMIRFY